MILIADPQRAFHSRVGQLLGSLSLVHAERAAEIELLLLEHPEIDAILLGPNFGPEQALEIATRLQSVSPDVGAVLVAETLTPDLLRSALRVGMRDVISEPFTAEQLHDALERAREYSRHLRSRNPEPTEAANEVQGKIVTVFSSKGGSGKSFVSSNLAVLLAQRGGGDVALVDLDLQSGDLAIMLQVLPAWTIYDASESQDRLDAQALKGYLTPHRSGVKLLAAPSEPSLADAVSPRAVHRILSILRQEFRFVVIDSPALFTDHVLAALDESEECVLVASMDVPSIKNLKLALQTLDKLGMSRDRIRLLLNRADSNVGLRITEVEKAIGTHIDIAVPSSREVPLSVNHGVPLALEKRKSPIVEPLARLADEIRGISEEPQQHQEPRRRGFLRRD